MQTILAETLVAIAAERPRSFDRSFRLVEELRLLAEHHHDLPRRGLNIPARGNAPGTDAANRSSPERAVQPTLRAGLGPARRPFRTRQGGDGPRLPGALPQADLLRPLRGGKQPRTIRVRWCWPRSLEELLREYGEVDLADRLASEIPPELPWELVVDLLDILVLTTSDNGAALQRAAEGWLKAGDDLRRIRMALHLEVYPFLDRSEMEEVLSGLAARYPEFAVRCRELIESRRRLAERQSA